MNNTEEKLKQVLSGISGMEEVESIGISGGKELIPQKGESDIDIFIYCDSIPDIHKRKTKYETMSEKLGKVKLQVFQGGHWGIGDFCCLDGIEVWMMYFTKSEAMDEINGILSGNALDKPDNYYYPVGRCAMLKNIKILYDRNDFLKNIKNYLSVFPEEFANKMICYHMDKLNDVEDLERAVSRKDVLFYHFALDRVLDHFLQALFSINREFFPSRKRSFEYIRAFKIKPHNCEERLLELIRKGSSIGTIKKSYKIFKELSEELKSFTQV